MIIAHRGLSANTEPHAMYMENTLPAIRRAQQLGFKAVEVDVQLTLDSIPILWHDDHVCWTNDTKVTRTTYRDLKRIIKTHRLLRHITGEVWEPACNKRLDMLKQVLTKFPNLTFCLELKIPSTRNKDTTYKQQLVTHVTNVVKHTHHNACQFLSFDAQVCRLLKHPNRQVRILTEKSLGRAARIAHQDDLDGVVYDATLVSASHVKRVRTKNPRLDW